MATMEPGPQQRTYRATRANGHLEGGSSDRRAHHANKRWVAEAVSGRSGASTSHAGGDSERWERGGHRGGGRGRTRGGRGKFGNTSVTFRRNGALSGGPTGSEGEHSEMEEDANEPETPEEREKFWQEVRRKHGFLWLRSPYSRLSSWLRPESSSAKKLLRKARWTIPINPNVSRTRLRWSEHAWICVLALNDIDVNARTTYSNGKRCAFLALQCNRC